MTPEELRRLARRLRDRAQAMLRSSVDLTGVVRWCRGSLDRIPASSRSAWTGRAAAGFLGAVAERRRLLDDTLDRVSREARRLDARADDLLAEALRLERQADDLEASGSLASLAS